MGSLDKLSFLEVKNIDRYSVGRLGSPIPCSQELIWALVEYFDVQRYLYRYTQRGSLTLDSYDPDLFIRISNYAQVVTTIDYRSCPI